MVPAGFAKEVQTCPIGLPGLLTTRSHSPGHSDVLRELFWLHSRTWPVSTQQDRGAEMSHQQGGYGEEFSK